MKFSVPADNGGGDSNFLNEAGEFLMVVKKWIDPKESNGNWYIKCMLEEVPPIVEGVEPASGRISFYNIRWSPRAQCPDHSPDARGQGAKRCRDLMQAMGLNVPDDGGMDTDATIGRPLVVTFEMGKDGQRAWPTKVRPATVDQIADAMDYVRCMWGESK